MTTKINDVEHIATNIDLTVDMDTLISVLLTIGYTTFGNRVELGLSEEQAHLSGDFFHDVVDSLREKGINYLKLGGIR